MAEVDLSQRVPALCILPLCSGLQHKSRRLVIEFSKPWIWNWFHLPACVFFFTLHSHFSNTRIPNTPVLTTVLLSP